MTSPGDFPLGPVKCSRHSIADLLAEILFLLDHRDAQPRTIHFINAHVFNLAFAHRDERAWLAAARVVAADGMSVVWAGRLLGEPLRERCNMTEAFRAFLADAYFPPTSAVLIGGQEADARRAAEAIHEATTHLRVTRAVSGYLQDEDYVNLLAAGPAPDLILVGMGSPRSEQLAQRLAAACPASIVWHIGGGTIQFYAGRLREAPAWMRRAGLQWLHRLCVEPGRMWRRYLIGNPLFVARILRLALRRRRPA